MILVFYQLQYGILLSFNFSKGPLLNDNLIRHTQDNGLFRLDFLYGQADVPFASLCLSQNEIRIKLRSVLCAKQEVDLTLDGEALSHQDGMLSGQVLQSMKWKVDAQRVHFHFDSLRDPFIA